MRRSVHSKQPPEKKRTGAPTPAYGGVFCHGSICISHGNCSVLNHYKLIFSFVLLFDNPLQAVVFLIAENIVACEKIAQWRTMCD